MFKDVEGRMMKKNKILFTRESESLRELVRIMDNQGHRVLVLWALDCGNLALKDFESVFPGEMRPRRCLEACERWAKGDIKMQEAKRAILDSHAVAKEIDDEVCKALCHGIGHAGATVHAGSHAIGLPMYELTAIVLSCKMRDHEDAVKEKIDIYIDRLLYWRENADKLDRKWADFLRRD
ncbi:MAG: hypothetical protein NUK57_11595 [Gudongella sp.]|nr:hypothetical protein [Gudongella sp.]